MTKTWFITGSTGGLGRALVETVLRQGDNAVATARDISSLEALRATFGNALHLVPLDVTDKSNIASAVRSALDRFGKIDVLINNAGYTKTAAFEQLSAEQFDRVVETNFTSVANLIRVVLPEMRAQRNGTIINVSSGGGRMGLPSQTAYCAAKAAVGNFTEALAQEVAPFGVKVISVEPGSMRTNFGNVALSDIPEPTPDYIQTAGAFLLALKQMTGNERGDVEKVAKAIVSLPTHDALPAHLLLGSDVMFVLRAAERKRADLAAAWEDVSRSTDADDADFSWLENATGQS